MSKSAREIFEELGYKQDTWTANISYVKNEDDDLKIEKIWFNHDKKTVNKPFNRGINMKELQAINQQCKELGWLNDK